MEACRQHVHEKAADELVSGERHHLIAFAPFEPVVLPLEGDALVIEREQAAVGDGDPVGVAGEIAQHLLRTAEGALAIDHPLFAVQRPQIRGERLRIDQPGMLAEELQLTGLISGTELVQNNPRNNSESTGTARKKRGRHETQLLPSSENPPPGTIMCTCGWWVIAEPQLWRTDRKPIRAPRCLGSAAMVSMVSDEALNSRS